MSLLAPSAIRLSARPITQDRFRRFGEVIAPGEGPARLVNDGRATRFDDVATLDHDPAAGHLAFALYRVAPSPWPVRIALLERHPLSAQLFVPMAAGPYVVATAPDDGRGGPAFDALEAFAVGTGVGVCYRPGVWHLPMMAFGVEALFAMWMWEARDGRDTVERRLERPVQIDF